MSQAGGTLQNDDHQQLPGETGAETAPATEEAQTTEDPLIKHDDNAHAILLVTTGQVDVQENSLYLPSLVF